MYREIESNRGMRRNTLGRSGLAPLLFLTGRRRLPFDITLTSHRGKTFIHHPAPCLRRKSHHRALYHIHFQVWKNSTVRRECINLRACMMRPYPCSGNPLWLPWVLVLGCRDVRCFDGTADYCAVFMSARGDAGIAPCRRREPVSRDYIIIDRAK